jgi:hypothetical protein
MRYLTATAASYAGVDLHATGLHLCVLDQGSTVRYSRKLKADTAARSPKRGARERRPHRPATTLCCNHQSPGSEYFFS